MRSEVAELIEALHAGSITLEQAANRFRERPWPRTRGREEPQSYLEMAAAAQEDPKPDVPGSFDEVVAAYDRGDLSREEYMTLAEAASEGMKREDSAKVNYSD